MKASTTVALATFLAPLVSSCGGSENQQEGSIAEMIVDMERVALEGWRQGDPGGFLDIIADDYTYFDPFVDERVDGREAIEVIYEGIRGQVNFPRFELIDPRVQVLGDIAILTFNFRSYGPDSTGSEIARSHWHTTEIFRRHDSQWRLISTHWSYTQPWLTRLSESGQLTGETTDFPRRTQASPAAGIPSLVVGMERTALNRWGAGDPSGYLDIMAEDYTYFDPSLEKRIDGLQAMVDYLEPIRGQIEVSRYEMIDPYVQTDGMTAVLTFNLKDWGVSEDGSETQGGHWHSTEVYSRVGAEWKLISTHWSYTASWLEEIAGSL